MIIIVSGYRGSGKSLFGQVAKDMGFPVFEMSEPILELMKELGMEISNESVRNFATDFREKGGPAAVAKLLLPKVKLALQSSHSVVIIGARSREEVDVFQNAGQVLSVAVISQEEKRFERVSRRGKQSDPHTKSDFRWADDVESRWGLKKLLEASQEKVRNDSTPEAFRSRVEGLLSKYA